MATSCLLVVVGAGWQGLDNSPFPSIHPTHHEARRAWPLPAHDLLPKPGQDNKMRIFKSTKERGKGGKAAKGGQKRNTGVTTVTTSVRPGLLWCVTRHAQICCLPPPSQKKGGVRAYHPGGGGGGLFWARSKSVIALLVCQRLFEDWPFLPFLQTSSRLWRPSQKARSLLGAVVRLAVLFAGWLCVWFNWGQGRWGARQLKRGQPSFLFPLLLLTKRAPRAT